MHSVVINLPAAATKLIPLMSAVVVTTVLSEMICIRKMTTAEAAPGHAALRCASSAQTQVLRMPLPAALQR